MRRRRNTPKGRRGRAGATGGRAGTARTSAPAPARPVGGVWEPLARRLRSLSPETIVRCPAPRSRGALGVGEARGGRGDCDSGPGDPRLGCHLPRAPAVRPHPAAASGSGWELTRGARPFLPFVAAASWAAAASGMQEVPLLAPRHPSSTFSPSPPPLSSRRSASVETKPARPGVRSGRGMRPWRSPGCAKFCLLGPAKGAWGRGGGGSRSRPQRPRTFSFAAFERVRRAF